MTGMTTIPVADDFTADDLDSLPDDGNRYELLDGQLLVTPSPVVRHQSIAVELTFLLRAAVPPGLRVLAAPMDVRLGPKRQVQPDVLVVLDEGLDGVRVESVPLLAVEVLSPATRSRDLVMKRRVYEQAGIASYWIVDPRAPAVTVLDLKDGAYVEVARVEGEQVWTVTAPYAVTVRPSQLLR